MNINDLEKKMDKTLSDYAEAVDLLIDQDGTSPIKERELHQFAKEVFYTFNEFKKYIIEYLKEKS